MATSTAVRGNAHTPPVAERITIALVPKVAAELQRLQGRTGMSKTDLTNRAISLYEFIEAQLSEGRELLIRDKVTGETRSVVIV
jgi:hypothetical protein